MNIYIYIYSYDILIYIYIYKYIYIIYKVMLVTTVDGDTKAPFSIVTTPRYRERRYSIPWIAPFYP